jgi:hypothetical protein
MKKRNHFLPACVLLLRASALCLLLALALPTGVGARRARSRRATAQGRRVDIRLRSLTTRATGKLTVEASAGGGRARLTTLNLPDPQTVAAGATTYVVWAVSGGRVVRLGELKRDERGNGGLAFDRPEGFDRYGVIVTAEATADAERPSDPVLSSRADEAAALYTNEDASGERAAASDPRLPAPSLSAGARASHAAGDFYAEVDDALRSHGGGRVLRLQGDSSAPRAGGAARATVSANRAYVRVSFRGVPLPSAVGANVYVLWAVTPSGRIVYMGSLPVTRWLNAADTYVRVAGFDADDYTLFVTAEQHRPAPAPSSQRILSQKSAMPKVR